MPKTRLTLLSFSSSMCRTERRNREACPVSRWFSWGRPRYGSALNSHDTSDVSSEHRTPHSQTQIQYPTLHFAGFFRRPAALCTCSLLLPPGDLLPPSASCRGFSLQGCPFPSVDRFLSVKGLGVHALIDLPFSLCPSNMCAGDSPSQANLSCASFFFAVRLLGFPIPRRRAWGLARTQLEPYSLRSLLPPCQCSQV